LTNHKQRNEICWPAPAHVILAEGVPTLERFYKFCLTIESVR
jgi:hypothetical protein